MNSLNWIVGTSDSFPELKRVFGKENGRDTWEAGDRLVQKDLGKKGEATARDLEYVELCRTLGGLKLLRYDLGILRQSIATMLRGRGLKF